MGNILFGAWKHQAKDGREVVYCTEDDRDNIHLTDAGKIRSRKIGAEGVLIPAGFDYQRYHAIISTFARVLETHEGHLMCVVVDPRKVVVDQRYQMDFFGTNWDHEFVPEDEDSRAVHKFVQNLYFQRDEGAPNFSRFVFGTLDSLISGVEIALRERRHLEGDQFLSLGTHTYILDALAMGLFGYFTVDPDDRTAYVHENKFPGMYGKEDFVTGWVLNPDGKPALEVKGKGVESKLIGLDQLKQRRDEVYKHTMLTA